MRNDTDSIILGIAVRQDDFEAASIVESTLCMSIVHVEVVSLRVSTCVAASLALRRGREREMSTILAMMPSGTSIS